MHKYWLNFWKYRVLLKELVVNDIKIKYRKSILGILWSVLQPLLIMIILTIVFSTLFRNQIPNFAVYVLTGKIIWDLYSQATSFAMTSIISNSALIKKVYVPKYLFPLAKCISAFVQTSFSLIALLIVAIISGIKINITIFLLPLPLLYAFLFSTGIGLLLSAYAVFFRDLNHLYSVVLTAWMYLTAIFYPVEILPSKYQILVRYNPVYIILDTFREIVMLGNFPSLKQNIMCIVFSVMSLVIGLVIFQRKQDKFILYI